MPGRLIINDPLTGRPRPDYASAVEQAAYDATMAELFKDVPLRPIPPEGITVEVGAVPE